MRIRRFIMLLAALVVLGAAPAAVAAGPSSDQEIADQAVLSLEDVPEGFEESDSGDDSDLSVAGCDAIQKAADAVNRAPNAEVSFNAGSGGEISVLNNQVTVLPSARRAKALSRPYAAPKARRCLNEGFAESFAAQASGNPDVTADFEPFEPAAGDAAIGYKGTVEVTTEDGAVEYFLELEVIRVGRGLASFLFLNTNTPPPSDDVSAMVEAVVTRLEDALA